MVTAGCAHESMRQSRGLFRLHPFVSANRQLELSACIQSSSRPLLKNFTHTSIVLKHNRACGQESAERMREPTIIGRRRQGGVWTTDSCGSHLRSPAESVPMSFSTLRSQTGPAYPPNCTPPCTTRHSPHSLLSAATITGP